ncbi:hypothetical protein N0V94_007024 [Neodidymelliopsis sp. IMI 364377]|nr:hypothetical protein N0V94_007024 [Neodidymelliopsis sp. IMI 364377]
MPRIPTALLRKARTIDLHLPALLAPCRDLHSAQNELRWLREHAEKVVETRRAKGDAPSKGAILRQLAQQRARGKPIQYILGTEYFGNLEIDAKSLPNELRMLDLCTGTGCIPLLFRHEFTSKRQDVNLRITGVDISEKSMSLARHNLKDSEENIDPQKGTINFVKADVLADHSITQRKGFAPPLTALLTSNAWPSSWDILVSNPPYISPSAYWKTTTRAVRGFEPKLALVPPETPSSNDTQQDDLFYPRLLQIANKVAAKVVLLEVADLAQALRVAQHARGMDIFEGIEIWREEPSASLETSTTEDDIPVHGEGNARSVVCWRGAGGAWLGKTTATTP